MAVDIELAINLMQAVNRQLITANLARKAPDLASYPTVIDTADLPYLLTWPSNGSFYIKGGGYKVDRRTMLVIGYVQPFGQNDVPSRAVQGVRLLQAAREKWISAATVPLADPGANSGYQITIESGPDSPLADGGLQSDLKFAGKDYHGFVLRVNINILWSV